MKLPRPTYLFSPCCRRKCTLFGQAHAFGGVHWCGGCGKAWRVIDLMPREEASVA